MSTVTLGEVAQLADQLPVSEQMKLLAHLCQQLRVPFPAAVMVEGNEPQARQIREAIADTFLQELDTIAETIEGQFDVVADLRQIRQQRANQL
jgi:hypothetical protein